MPRVQQLQEKVGESISHQTEGNSERGRTAKVGISLNCLESCVWQSQAIFLRVL